MREQAMDIAESLFDEGDEPPPAICVFDPDFHEGVVGIVASRIKDKLHRPAFVFAASQAPGKEHELKGSGRSIAGFHLRDALDLVAKRHPGVLLRFGGHAMAAGCTMAEDGIWTPFEQALNRWPGMAGRRHADPPPETDGPLEPNTAAWTWWTRCTKRCGARALPHPPSAKRWRCCPSAWWARNTWRSSSRHQGQPVDGIWFGHTEPLPARVKLAFRLDADEWNGARRVRFWSAS
jgi:single-stranded-DNA-specific exonuclease